MSSGDTEHMQGWLVHNVDEIQVVLHPDTIDTEVILKIYFVATQVKLIMQ